MCKYFEDFKIFPTSIVKEKQNPQYFIYWFLRPNTIIICSQKLIVHNDSNATSQSLSLFVALK